MEVGLTLFGRRLALAWKALPPLSPVASGSTGGWYPVGGVIREPFTGAWQQNLELAANTALRYAPVFACVTLIAADIGKVYLRLMEQDDNGIWTETNSPAFSPVLRKPNRYQTRIKFVESWITSKLIHGNAYVLKQRDARGIVVALYVLDPTRVRPLVTSDGDVYYQLTHDNLSTLSNLPPEGLTVPAREIIHDPMVTLYHPLVGVSPIYACGLAAAQGLAIQTSSTKFFSNGSNPGGVLTAPGAIADDTAQRLKAYWDTNFSGENAGKIAVLGDGLKYEAMHVNATDAQLIDQLKWSGETICSCFHVPAYMVGIAPPPRYANMQPLMQQYYAQCLQSLMANLEVSLDEGLELPTAYGTEFDPEDLIWLDTATKTKAAGDAIGSSAMTPDEARKRYFGLGPVPGGDTPYMQQQYFSLKALAQRDAAAPFAKPAPPPPAVPSDNAPAIDELAAADVQALAVRLRRKQQERRRAA